MIAREPGSAYVSGMTDSLFKFKVYLRSIFSLFFVSSFTLSSYTFVRLSGTKKD